MSIEAIIEAIKGITAERGYFWTPSIVSGVPSTASRSVCVEEGEGDHATITVNATGDCYEGLRQAILNEVGDAVTILPAGEKQEAVEQADFNLYDPDPIEDDDDAVTEETDDNGGQG